jgi:uncharacterized protein YbjQ (UPF0145 family)
MRKPLLFAIAATALLAASGAQARDDLLTFKIQAALDAPTSQGKIGSDVALFWGDQPHPAPKQTLDTATTNKKTNAFNKSDEVACQINLASAIITLQEHAREEGGDAVVDIHSFYKSHDFSSQTDYQCGAGAFVSGVALRGTVVKLH